MAKAKKISANWFGSGILLGEPGILIKVKMIFCTNLKISIMAKAKKISANWFGSGILLGEPGISIKVKMTFCPNQKT